MEILFDTFLLVDAEEQDIDVIAFVNGLRKLVSSVAVIALYRTLQGKEKMFNAADRSFDKDDDRSIRYIEDWIESEVSALRRKSNAQITVIIDGEEEKMGIVIETIVKDLQVKGNGKWKIALLLGNEEQREKMEWLEVNRVFMKPCNIEKIVDWICASKAKQHEGI